MFWILQELNTVIFENLSLLSLVKIQLIKKNQAMHFAPAALSRTVNRVGQRSWKTVREKTLVKCHLFWACKYSLPSTILLGWEFRITPYLAWPVPDLAAAPLDPGHPLELDPKTTQVWWLGVTCCFTLLVWLKNVSNPSIFLDIYD